jgi:hypothetical protein
MKPDAPIHKNNDLSSIEDNRSKEDKQKDLVLLDLLGSKKKSEYIYVNVASPFNVYYDGPALSLSAQNDSGPFDILPEHHNFICILIPSELAIRLEGGRTQKIQINGGLLHIRDNKANIFLDI